MGLRYIILTIILFWLSGCTNNQLLVSNEINKVNVVKYAPYMRHYRAYFTRTHLQPVINKRKYLFLYAPRKKELALLLHRNGHYFLYSFTTPDKKPSKFKTKKDLSRKELLGYFKSRGYHIANLTRLGFDIKVGLRRYKGAKTLMFELKDYRRLKRRYEAAIRHYNSAKIMHIKTPLPKKFIYPYFLYHYKRAKTASQKRELQRIANRLHIKLGREKSKSITRRSSHLRKLSHKRPKVLPYIPQRVQDQERMVESEISPNEEVDQTAISIMNPSKTTANLKPYSYYLRLASLYELSNYLDDPQNTKHLSHTQYHMLTNRLTQLEKEQLLQEGSLEELITAYKTNKNPRFKKRILELMKKKQEDTTSE